MGLQKNILFEKYNHLKNILLEMEQVLLAYSGGVDSTLLLKASKKVLGDNVLAVTALSPTTPLHERRTAAHMAETFGVRHIEIETHELELDSFAKNPADKCYICKRYRFAALLELSKKEEIAWVIDGENADDCLDYRPGSKATKELGVRSPLREANLTKEEIRRLSRQLNLPTWDKPASACLASRIPYGNQITVERLKQVDEGETFLRDMGFIPALRVRHHGDTARIELAEEDFDKLLKGDVRDKIIVYFHSLGFQFVCLDLEGYQMGSLNRSLDQN
jgi:uncharacterized protein